MPTDFDPTAYGATAVKDDDFDPTKYGATAIQDEKSQDFDPTAHGASPVDLANQELAKSGISVSSAGSEMPKANVHETTLAQRFLGTQAPEDRNPAEEARQAKALSDQIEATRVQPLNDVFDNKYGPMEGARQTKKYIQAEASTLNPNDPENRLAGFTVPGAVRGNAPTEVSPELATEAYKNAIAPAGKASADFLESQYSPENLALLGAFSAVPTDTIPGRIVHGVSGAYFTGKMAPAAYRGAKEAYQKAQEGDIPGAVESGTGAALDAAFAADTAMGVKHAIHPDTPYFLPSISEPEQPPQPAAAPAEQAPAPQAPPDPVTFAANDRMQESAQAMANAQAKENPAPPPPPAPEPPPPPMVTDDVLGSVGQAIQNLPKEQQPAAVLEATQKIEESLLHHGGAIVDGEVHRVDTPQEAKKVAQKIVNQQISLSEQGPEATTQVTNQQIPGYAESPGAQSASEADVERQNEQKRILEQAAQNPERRENTELRKTVAEMSPEERAKALLTSEQTGLPNRRAFNEAEQASKSPALAISDADGLKALNDKYGYEAGNALLKAKAEALQEAGLEAYHDKGDEFLYRGTNPEELASKLEQARELLRNREFQYDAPDGKSYIIKGADFSYGTGPNLFSAEKGLHNHKGEREARGERKRGELLGIDAREVTSGRDAQVASQEVGPADKEPWQKREEEIKARVKESKAAGNPHVSQLDPSVEGMRGVHFTSLRDGTGGTITTVDNRGIVYYQEDNGQNGMVALPETQEWVVDGRRKVKANHKTQQYEVSGPIPPRHPAGKDARPIDELHVEKPTPEPSKGQRVTVDGKPGTLVSTSSEKLGHSTVKFDDGSVKLVPKRKIQPVQESGLSTEREQPERGNTNAGSKEAPSNDRGVERGREGELASGDHRGAVAETPAGAGVPEGTGNAANERPVSRGYSLADYDTFRKQLRSGEVNAEALRQNYEQVKANEAPIKAELNKLTVPELRKRAASFYANTMKKAELVNEVYDTMLDSHVLGGYSYSGGIGGGMENIKAAKLRARDQAVQDITDEQIQKHAAEKKAHLDNLVKSLKNPETYDEFRRFIGYKGESALTPEQKIKWDEIQAERNKQSGAQELERKATVSGIKANTELTYKEGKHTKTGEALHIVQMKDRVAPETYKELNSRAKQLGGHYSSFIKADAGFQFKSKEAAEKFMQVANGESVSRLDQMQARKEEVKDNAVDRLRSVAENMEAKANESLNRERLDNTVRRARMAENAESSARSDLAMAKTLRNLAQAIEGGHAKHLEGLRTRTQVEALDSALTRAKYDAGSKGGERYEEYRDRPATIADIAHAEYPYPSLDKSGLLKFAGTLENRPGGKLLANRLRKYAAQTGEMEWFKFRTPDQIEDYRSLAKKVIGWDQKSLAERIANHDRLQAAGIPDEPTLRAALREYLDYKGDKPAADKLRQAKRAMVGKTYQGADYFPTPEDLAQKVAEAADIKPGMKVLEPSAGTGNLIDAVKAVEPSAEVHAVEPMSDMRSFLTEAGHNLVGHDFMDYAPEEQYDRVVMNPPFHSETEHVRKAYDLLKPGGKLVAIMSESPFSNSTKMAQEFRDWLDSVGGESEKNPEGSFKNGERSTGVATRMVTIEKHQPEVPKVDTYRKTVEEEPKKSEHPASLEHRLKTAKSVAKDTARSAEERAEAKETVKEVREKLAEAKPEPVIAENHALYPEKESVVRRLLNRESEKGKPAFVVGDEIYTLGGKSRLSSDHLGNGRITVRPDHDLSKEGFERALESYANLTGNEPDKWTSYNPEAKAYAEKLNAEKQAKAEAKAKQEAAEREKRDAEYRRAQEVRAEIEKGFADAKFKQATVKVPMRDGSTVEVKGPSIDGLVVHKAINAGRDAGYDVTHVNSGRGVLSGFHSQSDAKVAAYRLSKIGNWNRPGAELEKDQSLRDPAAELARSMRKGGAYAPTEKELAGVGTQGNAPTSTTPPSQIRPGARSAFTGNETGRGSLQDLTSSIKANPSSGTATAKAPAPSLDEAVQNSKGMLASLWDAYKNPRPSSILPREGNDVSDYLKAVGNWDLADQESALNIRELRKATEKSIPDVSHREAITPLVEAGFDEGKLRQQIEQLKQNENGKKYVAQFEKALKLSDAEKTIARNVASRNEATGEEMEQAGLIEQALEDYMMHAWKDNDARKGVLAESNFNSLVTKPGITKKRTIPTYFDGIMKGLEPKTMDFAALTAVHERALREALAARTFIKSLTEAKASDGRPVAVTSWAHSQEIAPEEAKGKEAYMVRPNLKPGEEYADYRSINHPALRGWKWSGEVDGKPMFVQGDMLVHPEIYRHLKNNLTKSGIRDFSVQVGDRTFKPGETALKLSAAAKQSILSIIPSRFHRTTLELHALEHRTNPWSLPELDLNEPDQRLLVKGGLKVANYDGQEEFMDGLGQSAELFNKIPVYGAWAQAHSDMLFKDFLPRVKMKTALNALRRNRSFYGNRLSDAKIAQITAKEMNAAYGGLNYRYIGRNKTAQDALRLGLLAPDFLEARAKFVGQAFRPQGREQLHAYLLGAMVMYVGFRLLNSMIDHKPHWDKPFSLVMHGREYQLRTVQGDTMHLLTDPKGFAMSRVSPIVGLIAKEDQHVPKHEKFGHMAKRLAEKNAPIPAQPWLRNNHDSNAQKAVDTALRMVGINVKKEQKH